MRTPLFILTILVLAWAASVEAQQPQPNPYRGRTADLTLVDSARGKDLPIRVDWPEAPGPWPLIVWSHGALGSREGYNPLVHHWVSNGYVCIRATHSDSLKLGGRPRGQLFGDWKNRPRDVTFVLDSLDEIERRVDGLEGRIDRSRIGMGGHSFGAHTTQFIGGATTPRPGGGRESHADPRPSAFLMISPQGRGGELDAQSWDHLTTPHMTITGTRDQGRRHQDYTWRLDPWKHSPPEGKHLLVIESADHSFGGISGRMRKRLTPNADLYRGWVIEASTAFWDAYLKDDAANWAWLVDECLEAESGGMCRQKTMMGTASAAD